MLNRRHQHGRRGEEIAARYLQARGFRICERNWRPGNALRGEVDCIAWQGKVLCFIEVKTRMLTANASVSPQEAVTPSKQRQLSRLANFYVSARRLDDVPCRFDVVEVWLPPEDSKEPPRIELRQNAFDYCGF